MRGVCLPILQYLLVVGSVLTGLIFLANSVMVPDALPFSVSQMNGLPEPYKAPKVVNEFPKPMTIATTVEAQVAVKKPVKAAHKNKLTQVRQPVLPQGRYAAYPPREYGSTW
jgi:hypothetical protein